jgi:Flp pilus assembly protein CpaB
VGAALLVGAAAWAALAELAPAPPATVPTLVASRDIAVGEALGPENLATRDLPTDAVPPGAENNLGAASGMRAATPIGVGEVLTDTRTSTDRLLEGAGEDRVGAYVPVQEPPLLSLVVPGAHVDVLSTSDGSVLASDVPVLARPAGAPAEWGPDSAAAGLLLAVTPDEAARLAVATGSGFGAQGVAVVILPGRG